MPESKESTDIRDSAVEQSGVENYLPGMPVLSTDPGRVERFLTNLFRRRGEVRMVVRRAKR